MSPAATPAEKSGPVGSDDCSLMREPPNCDVHQSGINAVEASAPNAFYRLRTFRCNGRRQAEVRLYCPQEIEVVVRNVRSYSRVHHVSEKHRVDDVRPFGAEHGLAHPAG